MKEIEIFEDILDIEEKLNTDISSGLSRKEARRRALEGERTDTSFFVRKKRNFLSCFFGVVKMLPAAILIFIAIAAFFMGRDQLALAVLSTFISGSIISGMLYLSAQRESERMEAYSNPTARVLREGKEYITDSRNLVAGDIVILRRGDYVPADVCVVEARGLTVSAIVFDGEVKYITESIGGFDGADRLTAGSFIEDGYVRAVVTATGNDTVMSQYIRAGGLLRKNSDPAVIKRTYKHLSGFVFIISAVALILAIVGMFSAKYVGILEIFLMYLSLILSMTLISAPIAGRILLASMLKRAAKNRQGGDFAILKNNKAIDVLPKITDIVVCGISGLTDGKKYFSSMFLYGEHIDNIAAVSPDSFIFECIYSYIKAKEDSSGASDNEKRTFDGLLRGMQRIKFDIEAEDVKIRSLYFGANIDGGEAACVEMADLSFRVYVGDDFSIIDRCGEWRIKDGARKISDAERQLLDIYVKSAASRGEMAYLVVSELDGVLMLEGIVGLKEGLCESFLQTKEAFLKKNINVSVALFEDNEYNRCYLLEAGFDNDSIFAYDCGDGGSFDKSGAYVGYSAEDYANMIISAKERGRVVAAVGISDDFSSVYEASDIFASYDNLNYGSQKFKESEFETAIADGHEFSRRCSQRLRTEADVIIGRGAGESGGLRGFFEAVKCAESFTHNYLQMILLFISIVSALILMTFSSFVSGISFISYPVILLLAVALVFFTVAAFSTFKPRSFIEKKPHDLKELSRSAILTLIPPTVAAAAYFAFAVYLEASGYIMDVAAIPLSTTLGVIITYVLSFFGRMSICIGKKIDISDIKGFAQKEKSKNRILNVAAMTLVLTSIIRMVLTALIIPGFAYEYGYTGVCGETFALLGVYIAVFVICELVIRLLGLTNRKKHK